MTFKKQRDREDEDEEGGGGGGRHSYQLLREVGSPCSRRSLAVLVIHIEILGDKDGMGKLHHLHGNVKRYGDHRAEEDLHEKTKEDTERKNDAEGIGGRQGERTETKKRRHDGNERRQKAESTM